MELRTNGNKVGSIFPMNPNEFGTIPRQFEGIKEIYQTICKFYNEEEWTMKDFKSFRSKFAPRGIDEIAYIGDYITAFLRFPKEQAKTLISHIDQIFQFSILVERKKFVVVDPETNQKKECYRGVERPVEMGDVVTISNAIWAKGIQLIHIDTSNILNEKLRNLSTNEALSFLQKLSFKGSEELQEIVDDVVSDFDIHFIELLLMPEFVFTLLKQRENITSYVQEIIRRRMMALKNASDKVVKNYIINENCEKKLKKAKNKSRCEGYHIP